MNPEIVAENPEIATEAGREAAKAALQRRTGRRLSSPSAKLRQQWAANWPEFLVGWTETVKADREMQSSWQVCYSPGEDRVMDMTIYTERPPAFWQDMGPFFARRSVRREMPYLVDDEGYVWFLLRESGAVQGFASLHVDKKQVGHLHGLYVIPDRRQNGVADRLIRERLSYLVTLGILIARTVTNAKSTPLLQKHGFAEISTKGSYRVMEKRLDAEKRSGEKIGEGEIQ